jgi:hypothetical protein
MATIGQYIEKNGTQYKVVGREFIGKGWHLITVKEVIGDGELGSPRHLEEKDSAEAPDGYRNIGRPQRLINY